MEWKIKILLICYLIATSSCLPDQKSFDSVLVEKRLEERQSKYMAKKIKDCKERALEEASETVDEMLIEEINLSLLDSIKFPKKPKSPNHPGVIEIDDSTLVNKIIDN